MYNSMKPSFKESAVFALSAAKNFDWMNYEWLQCNRPFLRSPTSAWKSVLLVECQMKLDGRTEELGRFRQALLEFRAKLPSVQVGSAEETSRLPFVDVEPQSDQVVPGTKSNERLKDRITMLAEVGR